MTIPLGHITSTAIMVQLLHLKVPLKQKDFVDCKWLSRITKKWELLTLRVLDFSFAATSKQVPITA